MQLPASGSADSDLVANLWLPGELSGPAIIEVAGPFQLDAGTLPVTDALTSGALLWYEESIITAPPIRPPSGAPPLRSGPLPGDLVLLTLVREAALSFEALAPGDTAERLGVDLSGPLDSARFVDAAAASHGMQLRWWYSDGDQSLGFPENLDSACAFIGRFGCAALPPRDSAHLSNGQPHGEVRIRVYRAGQPVNVEIDTVYGPNPGTVYSLSGSFTTLVGENVVFLQASTTPTALGPGVAWAVVPAAQAAAETQAPEPPPQGATSQFSVPTPSNADGRWQAYGHPGALEVKRLGYEVRARVSSGATQLQSGPLRVYQDEIDVVRQEYIDLSVLRGVPSRGRFLTELPTDPGLNTGDYGLMVWNNDFVVHLNDLSFQWTAFGEWRINSYYRNPTHQRFHIPGASRPGRNSWHLFGCAADIQTFGDDAAARDEFWTKLASLADSLGFDYVEPQAESGVGHVHVEFHFCQLNQ